ncbi:hypothetical protein Tco_0275403 [Tanacetum coccineum]
MSTPAFVDPKSSTQADRAQSSRVPVPFSEDPYKAIRQAYLDGTDTESEPFEDPTDTEAPKTAHIAVRVSPAMSSGLSASMAEVEAMSESAFLEDSEEDDDDEEDEEIDESLDSDKVSEDAEDEGPTADITPRILGHCITLCNSQFIFRVLRVYS